MPLESIACAGDQKEIDDENGDENEGADDDVKGFEAEDTLFFLTMEIGRPDVVRVAVVAVIGFGHGYKGISETKV